MAGLEYVVVVFCFCFHNVIVGWFALKVTLICRRHSGQSTSVKPKPIQEKEEDLQSFKSCCGSKALPACPFQHLCGGHRGALCRSCSNESLILCFSAVCVFWRSGHHHLTDEILMDTLHVCACCCCHRR